MSNKEPMGQVARRPSITATLPALPSMPLASSSTRRRRRLVPWRVAVVDGCHYGRVGLVAALQGGPHWDGLKLRPTGVKDLGALHRHWVTGRASYDGLQFDCMVVRLPADPRAALSTLLQLGAPGMPLALAERLVVLTALTPELVLRVLNRVGVRLWVRVLDDRLPLAVLCRAVYPQDELYDPDIMAWSALLLADTGTPELSSRERGVLWQCLQMVSVHALARRLDISSKTLYTQRQGALNKLGAAHLKVLLRQFRVLPGNA
ncbi:LuxR C-terminal-related transcriptional regulator [Serratia sp. 2723]|uniref:LuxR C-terminal-related transcriptional regulator n=1 Tax=unclassified Serratia (in: enterobacteria) TaxID=2647522 RepID=UPI003D1B7B18